MAGITDTRVLTLQRLIKQVAVQQEQIRLIADGMRLVQQQVTILTNAIRPQEPAQTEPAPAPILADCKDLTSP